MLDFAHEHGLRSAEVEQQHVTDSVFDTDAHAVRSRRIVGVQDIPVHAVDEIDGLILSPHIHVIAEHTVQQKFHTHTRGEVE